MKIREIKGKEEKKRKGKRGRENLYLVNLYLVILFIAIFSLIFLTRSIALSSSVSQNMNLTIWDDTDSINKYSYDSAKASQAWDVYFYVNYTNSTTILDDTNANCTIRFDYNSSWTGWKNMSHNSTYNRFQFNRNFSYKGSHTFEINCTNYSSSSNLTDAFDILNTAPSISLDIGENYIDLDNDRYDTDYFLCTEDSLCIYNFSSNVTEVDVNDILTFNYSALNTTLTNFTLNSSIGILEINITHNDYTGEKKIELNVKDTESSVRSGILLLNISAVNDAPEFSNLENKSFNETQLFTFIINASDEENNFPFSFNVTFLNCSTAQWSDRNNTNCTLFSILNYSNTSAIINFTPTRNDVGSYIINFTVTDLNDNIQPYNATTSRTMNFTVLDVNDLAFFTYVCDNERNATEDTQFTCRINATDNDELYNLTFASNHTWFLNLTTINVTDFNASVLVNFTASDAQVGNWSIEINVTDTGNPIETNSTVFWFYIANVNDSVFLYEINNITAYKGVSYSIQVNASDDDLLIDQTQKNIFNESLNLSINISWISLTKQDVVGNITPVLMQFTINESIIGNHSINLSVADMSGNSYSRVFYIFANNNSAPAWNSSLNLNYNLTEDSSFSLNLSEHVSDEDGDQINFSFVNLTDFPSFSISLDTISFTPVDEDVARHSVRINASDGKADSEIVLNFTVSNINDAPRIASIGNQNALEDNETVFYIYIYDDDYLVQNKSFYNETLNYTAEINGSNTSLFALEFVSLSANTTTLVINFTPSKADVGTYSINISVSDASNITNYTLFNLTINEINHVPGIYPILNQSVGMNENFYLQVNVSDIEDGNSSSGNFTFNLSFLSGASFFSINESYGIINVTPDSSQVGSYRLNVSVSDTENLTNFTTFWLYVYDVPRITTVSHTAGSLINSVENESVSITVTANHTVGDSLNYSWYIDNELRNSSSGTGTGLPNIKTWDYLPNFTEATCGNIKNLTLVVSNPKFSNSTSWNLTINNTNSPISFSASIPNISVSGSSTSITLSSYFSDVDSSNLCVNQSVNFSYVRMNSTFAVKDSGTISVSISNWTLTFSSSSAAVEYFRIVGVDLNETGNMTRAESNNFSVSITPLSSTTTGGGGGGGGGAAKPILLKIILPSPVSLFAEDRIELPVMLKNTGTSNLKQITLRSSVFKDGAIGKELRVFLSKYSLSELQKGKSENITLTIVTNGSEAGTYELFINASVKEPKYDDWGKMYIEVKKMNETDIEKLIIFTEELIVGNPECLELREMLEDAKLSFRQKRYDEAINKLNDVIDACKYALTQRKRVFIGGRDETKIFIAVAIISVSLFFSGVVYHILRRIIFKRKF